MIYGKSRIFFRSQVDLFSQACATSSQYARTLICVFDRKARSSGDAPLFRTRYAQNQLESANFLTYQISFYPSLNVETRTNTLQHFRAKAESVVVQQATIASQDGMSKRTETASEPLVISRQVSTRC